MKTKQATLQIKDFARQNSQQIRIQALSLLKLSNSKCNHIRNKLNSKENHDIKFKCTINIFQCLSNHNPYIQRKA